MKAVRLMASFGAVKPYVSAPDPVPGSIDIRAVDVSYANGTTSFGNDWDTSYPVATSAILRIVGFRFQCNIPRSATILSATLTPYQNQNETWTSADNRTLGAEQVNNAGIATSNADIHNRYGNVGVTHNWSNSGTILNSQPVPSGNIAALVQEIVNRGGWNANQHIMLWCSHPGNGGQNAQWRSVVSQSVSVQPRLEVGFEYIP